MKKRSRIIVCGQCQESMTIAFFVNRHRSKSGVPCRTVPCDSCGTAVNNNAHRLATGLVFCGDWCKVSHPSWRAIQGGKVDVDETLEAMERSEWLPDRYHGQGRTEAG